MVESGGDPAAGQGEPAAGDPWAGAYKIPWQDPAFSRRMLAEHLSQAHDLASRRLAWIDRQVAWIDETVLGGRPADILDLGCGPGLYCHRLAERGHRCRGIDFGPAAEKGPHLAWTWATLAVSVALTVLGGIPMLRLAFG